MNHAHILLPMAVLAIWTLLVIVVLSRRRIRAVKERRMDPKFYRRYDDGREPDEVRYVVRNLTNLFETPVLFYAVCIVAVLAGATQLWLVILAWLYVALRLVHTVVHINSNVVRIRFNVFLVSYFVLFAMWVLVAVNLIQQLA